MALESLQDLFVHELKDILSAEGQLAKALPKMAKAAKSPDLEKAFTSHLEETKVHIERLEKILTDQGEKPKPVHCKGMEGLVEEGSEMISEKAPDMVKDAGLISAAQRCEHYEMAAYGCVRTYAKVLGHKEAEKLLAQTLKEEEAADKKLSTIAESHINAEAAGK